MEIFGEETEFMDMRKIQKVVGMFERCPRMQRIVRTSLLGLEYEDELDDVDEDNNEIDSGMHDHYNFHGYPMLSELSGDRGFRGNSTRPPHSVYQPTRQYYASVGDFGCQAKESDIERKAKLLQEMERSKEKAEKKRLKKENQKRRKQLEKEKQNHIVTEEEKNNVQQSKAEESERANEKSKDGANSSVKKSTSAKDSDSSEDDYSGEDSDKNDFFESEELDMASTFVSKAAQIAKRKSEQRPKPEKKEKKKIPVKECKTAPDKCPEDLEVKKKDSPAPNPPTFEDNIKKSTDLAVIGNRFASSGDFNMAVKFFTDAIKYNPTEFKLFGNRSFCFEKMQQYEKALADAELCLSLYPGWVKGLFRKGRALAGLKRYEEAAEAFHEVLKLDNSYTEASHELMRVQIAQLMDCGFTWQQSSNALIVHGTVNEALRVLSKLNHHPGTIQNGNLPAAQVPSVGGHSPVHTANTNPAASSHSHQSQNAPKTSLSYKPIGPAQNTSSPHKPDLSQPIKSSHENSQPPPELFPVWVGNLVHSVTNTMITNLFSKAGVVYSVKVLGMKRCAFVNFTKQEYCDEAIKQFHGFELNGMKLAVRYPDRIPHGMGISRSALKADDPQNENTRYNSTGGRRYVFHHRQEHKTATSPDSTLRIPK